ncbi:D-aminoacyl-tRNA deacylase [Pseudobacteriovorax antillogorgiicola]|uniref:D-aminoacyl-tRNA deacylase n=1 Tax=Pseudobacteriovorax antillogorgiicola TaxID=1513793 RepID=A0A1Y6B2T2_9BACT|nr:D-aminoacyl-tRNA deacylase [Pseudobacteriovorax antillogorgiicola]TCS59406.1 D-tyrosyl-tRNA(Tyr) deacylase [Pseudobacteriovorax antillogorgiicola]SME88612.1 D-tyrosyl-tRNA(Tyr) deacylase [Pseudobacteriovorax antillogorgiicola]
MRAVVQRVKEASVTVEGKTVGSIAQGLLVFLGIGQDDKQSDIAYIRDKVVNLRIFNDDHGNMNLSAADLGAEILLVSQFTLYGDCRKGRRPSFNQSAPIVSAKEIYEASVTEFKASGLKIETGRFQAHMNIASINDGPVTIMLDSQKLF